MKRPLTGLVIAYAAGIWLGSLVDVSWPKLLLCTTVWLVVFLALGRSRYSLIPLLATVVCAGMFAYRFSTTSRSLLAIDRLVERRDQNISLRGVIVSDPGYREAEGADAEPTGDRHSFKLDLAALNVRGDWVPATGRVLVFISATRQQPPLHYGDRIDCTALLRVPPPERNPGTFDWRRWLALQNIQFTATIRKNDLCTVLGVDQGNPMIALSLRLREHFEKALRAGLESDPKMAGVLTGMIIGERSEIPPETYAEFQQDGVFHVFAINGLHVGLVAGIILLLLRAVHVPRRWCGLPAIPLLILYVFATGAHPGAVRALVMVCVWLTGRMFVRPVDGLSNLATAALVILLWQPVQLFDGGFILSFTVVLALLTIAPHIQSRMQGPFEPDVLTPRQLLPRWRLSLERPVIWLAQLFSCSLAAWIGLLPLMAVYFHLFTPISILANVLVVPMLGIIIALGMASAVAHAVWPWLAVTFNNANYFLLSTMIRGVEWLGRVPGGHQFVQAPPPWLVVGYYGLLALLLNQTLTKQHKRLALSVILPLLGAAIVFITWPEDVVEVTALSLPDGMAVFVNAPGEQHDILLDGGGDWSGERVSVPYLRGQGVDRLDTIVLTRGDKAHAGGLSTVVEKVGTSHAVHGGTGSRSKFFWNWLELIRNRQLPITTIREGDDWWVGRDLHLRVLNPPRESSYTRSDDNSVALLLEFGPTRLLLASDIGATVEQRWLANHTDLRAHVIIKGRHSGETSCTDAFLDAARPEAVVQCVSSQSIDRYLQPDLRDRLRQRDIAYYRTDETGAVSIRITSKGYTISTWIPQ